MKYKLICCDLDGTLLKDAVSMCEENKIAIKKAREIGVKFVISTGRTLGMCKFICDFLDIHDEVITSNGSYILNLKSGKTLYKKILGEENAFKVLELCTENELLPVFQTHNKIIVHSNEEYLSKYAQAIRNNRDIEVIVTNDARNEIEKYGNEILKCIVINKDHEKIKHARNQMNNYEDIEVSSSGLDNFEVNSKGVNKGAAICFLENYFGMKNEEIIAIGDSDNDISMISHAGLGIAVKNALDSVKEKADYITENSNENGAVAEIINKFVLGGKDEL